MVKIKAFRGLRPPRHLAAQIASKPYDVLNSDEARVEAAGNPYSFLRVVKSEIDLPPELNPYDSLVYEQAAFNLQEFIRQGWFAQDCEDNLYIYRQMMGDHTQYGLVGVAHVDDYLQGKIRIHELTREAKEKDRIRHVQTTSANTGPVFLTYRAQTEIDALIAEIVAHTPAEYDFTAVDQIRHTVWIIRDPLQIRQLVELFRRIEYVYVADGHHRSKSAVMVGQARREAHPGYTGEEEFNWFLAVFFPHNQLKILDYNRTVKDLHGLTPSEFIMQLQSHFDVSPVCCRERARPQQATHFGMYLAGEWYRLAAREGSFPAKDPVESLDVSILQRNLLTPILGIGDPRKDERIDFIGGIRGLVELEKRVDSGEAAVAFALFPTSIDQLMAIADAGQIMPPKSTWFEPKLRSGLIIHLLD